MPTTAGDVWISGNVGIGTTAPGVALDVNGEINSTYGFYHDRGDPADYDFYVTNFTTDGNWHDLNLSSIVPAGVKTVALYVTVVDDQANNYVTFRKNGNTNDGNKSRVVTPAPGVYTAGDLIVSCDENRVVEYRTANTTYTGIYVTVKGWWK